MLKIDVTGYSLNNKKKNFIKVKIRLLKELSSENSICRRYITQTRKMEITAQTWQPDQQTNKKKTLLCYTPQPFATGENIMNTSPDDITTTLAKIKITSAPFKFK